MTETKTYPLRLPRSVKDAVTQLARHEGVSVNQFIATAVAEKLMAMNTAEFFAERRERADLEACRTILCRPGGQPPQVGVTSRNGEYRTLRLQSPMVLGPAEQPRSLGRVGQEWLPVIPADGGTGCQR